APAPKAPAFASKGSPAMEPWLGTVFFGCQGGGLGGFGLGDSALGDLWAKGSGERVAPVVESLHALDAPLVEHAQARSALGGAGDFPRCSHDVVRGGVGETVLGELGRAL